jgi:hypothetical protein
MILLGEEGRPVCCPPTSPYAPATSVSIRTTAHEPRPLEPGPAPLDPVHPAVVVARLAAVFRLHIHIPGQSIGGFKASPQISNWRFKEVPRCSPFTSIDRTRSSLRRSFPSGVGASWAGVPESHRVTCEPMTDGCSCDANLPWRKHAAPSRPSAGGPGSACDGFSCPPPVLSGRWKWCGLRTSFGKH